MVLRQDHPQRLSPPAEPGALLKRLTGIARVRQVETGSHPVYLALVRQCPCLHCGMDPAYEAAHLRMASGAHGKASGLGKKPDDRWALPLCPEHHRLANAAQHHRAEYLFWHELGINPLLTAERLWEKRGDLVAMRAVVFTAIAERG